MDPRLTAILAADVVGYSRLMGANESGTVTALKRLQTDFVDGKISEQQGRKGLPSPLSKGLGSNR